MKMDLKEERQRKRLNTKITSKNPKKVSATSASTQVYAAAADNNGDVDMEDAATVLSSLHQNLI